MVVSDHSLIDSDEMLNEIVSVEEINKKYESNKNDGLNYDDDGDYYRER